MAWVLEKNGVLCIGSSWRSRRTARDSSWTVPVKTMKPVSCQPVPASCPWCLRGATAPLWKYDWDLYKRRNEFESLFRRLKSFPGLLALRQARRHVLPYSSALYSSSMRYKVLTCPSESPDVEIMLPARPSHIPTQISLQAPSVLQDILFFHC